MNRPIGRGMMLVAAVVFCAAYCAFIFFQQEQALFAGNSDFAAFYSAGHMVAHGQAALVYDRSATWQLQSRLFPGVTIRRGPLLYNHAPFELLLFAPLGYLSYAHALMSWYAVNLILLLAVPALLIRAYPALRNYGPLLYVAVAFFLPANIALLQGQDSIVLLLLFTLAFLNLRNRRDALAGCLMAVALFKPQLVLPLLVVAVGLRKWRLLKYLAGTCVVLTLVSAALVGWKATLGFPSFLLAFSRLPSSVAAAYPEAMPNLRGLIYSAMNVSLAPVAARTMVMGLSALTMVIVYRVCERDGENPTDAGLSLLLLADLLVSYHLNTHDLAVLLLPIFIVGMHVGREQLSPVRLALGMTAGLLLFVPSLLPPAAVLAAILLIFFALLAAECLRPNATAAGRIADAEPALGVLPCRNA